MQKKQLSLDQNNLNEGQHLLFLNKYTKQENIILQVIDDGYEKHVENGGAHSHHCEHKNAF